MNDAALTGAVVEVTMSDGTTYKMSALTDRSIVEIDMWLQRRVMEIAKDAVKEEPDEDVRREVIDVALKTAMTITWVSNVGAHILATPFGMARVVYQSAKNNHPTKELDEDKIRLHMQDGDNLAKINQAFLALNLAQAVDEKKEQRRKRKRDRPTTAGRRRGA